MKKIITAIFLTLCSGALVHGFENCSEPTRFALQGEFLYFKAVTDYTAFISSLGEFATSLVSHGKRVTNDPNYRPGFRIEADWMPCACFLNQLQVRYAHLKNNHTKTVRGIIEPTIITPAGFGFGGLGEASSNVHVTYNAGDVVLLRNFFNFCDFDFSFLAGLHVANIRYRERIFIIQTVNTINSVAKGTFWGIGPEVGFNFHYIMPCFCSLSLAGDVRGALLSGKTQGAISDADIRDTNLSYQVDPGNWGAIPELDARLGLNYAWSCARFHSNIEIGYEMIWYTRVIDRLTFQGGHITLEQYSNLSLHGPYAAFRISF